MIEVGLNPVKDLRIDTSGHYVVTLSIIRLPHLPLSKKQLVQLNRQPLCGQLGAPKQLSAFEKARNVNIDSPRTAMKICDITTVLEVDKQIIKGRVRSVGPSPNLGSFMREYGPKSLCFGIRANAQVSEIYPGAIELLDIVTWDIVAPPT